MYIVPVMPQNINLITKLALFATLFYLFVKIFWKRDGPCWAVKIKIARSVNLIVTVCFFKKCSVFRFRQFTIVLWSERRIYFHMMLIQKVSVSGLMKHMTKMKWKIMMMMMTGHSLGLHRLTRKRHILDTDEFSILPIYFTIFVKIFNNTLI